MDKYFKLLLERLRECIKLAVPNQDLMPLISRHQDELVQLIKDSKDEAFIKSKFNNYINKTLSTIETIELPEKQYKALRKLVLSEIHGCLDLVISSLKDKN
jgi:hypothetical protein